MYVEAEFSELLLGEVQEGIVAEERRESRSPGCHVGVLFVWRAWQRAPPGDGPLQSGFWVSLMALMEFLKGVCAAVYDLRVVVGVKELVQEDAGRHAVGKPSGTVLGLPNASGY